MIPEIGSAFGLPKQSESEKAARQKAIQEATRTAIEVPLEVMELGVEAMAIIKQMASEGNPNSVSDAGVGALAVRSGVFGAHLNVKINAKGITDTSYREGIIKKADDLANQAQKFEDEILSIVNRRF